MGSKIVRGRFRRLAICFPAAGAKPGCPPPAGVLKEPGAFMMARGSEGERGRGWILRRTYMARVGQGHGPGAKEARH